MKQNKKDKRVKVCVAIKSSVLEKLDSYLASAFILSRSQAVNAAIEAFLEKRNGKK